MPRGMRLFLGMIPGTVAYVAAGTVGKKLLLNAEGTRPRPGAAATLPPGRPGVDY